MTRLWCWALALAVLAVLAGPAGAQAPDMPPGRLTFRVFAGGDGLKNLVIIDLAQDAQGFLWLGTDDGVYRFDGERFTHFSVEDGLTSSLIYSLGIAPDGEVCAGSNNGLACWDGTRFSQAQTAGLPAIRVRTLASYGGALWVGTEGAGLYVRTGQGPLVPAPGWPGAPMIRALWADAGGLVAGSGSTVVTSTGDGRWQPIGEVGLGREQVDGVARDRDGALWIRTPTRLWQLPAGGARAIDRTEGLPSWHSLFDVPHGIALGQRGELMVGTDAGVAIRDRDHWRLLERAVGTPAAAARAMLVDREDTLWIGSVGLVQLRGRGLIEHFNAASGLRGDAVWSFARDRAGTLWAGTSECLMRATGGRWDCLAGTEGRTVRSFVFAPGGGMFVGGSPSDLLYIDPAGHPRSLGEPSAEPDHHILALAFSRAGDLWIATRGGLFELAGGDPGDPGAPARMIPVVIPGTPAHDRFSSLVMVGDQVWTTTSDGVVVLDHGAWHRFGRGDGFRSSDLRYLAARADGRMCATYNEGLGATCFRYARGQVSEIVDIGPAQGLSTGLVYFLGEDLRHRLWLGTGDGVDVVVREPATGGAIQLEHFDERDGLAGDDSAARAFFVDRDGSLWLGATGGASHVLAQYYLGPPPPPRTTLTGGRLGDLVVHATPGGGLGSAETGAPIEVPHDRSALVVELAAGTLLDARRVEYQTRLAPIEAEWTPTHQRQVHYPALLPGVYQLEVRARLDAGAWGPISRLRFTVRPAWWQARWFYLLIGIAGLAAIGAGFTWRQRRVLWLRTRQLHEQSEVSFRAVIDQMPDLISVHRGLEVSYLNRASRRFLGLGEAAADRAALIERIHPDDRAQVAELFSQVRGMPVQHAFDVIEMRFRAADASWRTCEISGLLIELGGARTVVASARDVTERKRMRAKLLVSDRMASLGTLAAGIAHEINNPLAYVTGNLEVMAEVLDAASGPPSASERRELRSAIHDARDGAERVRRIVHGLRSFSRSEAEQRVALALPGVIEAAIRLTSNEIRHRARLVRELGPVPMVVADDGRLTQVFINLLVNAAHAIPEGHSGDHLITVRTRTDDAGCAVIEIEDTGCGIAPELQSRVFDPFFTTKDVGEGTGLGLSICHGIVSGLGGQISIESARPRAATVVRVVLPPAGALPGVAPAPATAPSPAAPPPRRRRVLLVDDELLVAQTMERLLRRDYDITVALCGQDAIDHIARGARFAAIVSDVMMPTMTGTELLEQLQEIAPDQARRMIFLSGGAFTAQTREMLDKLGAPQLEKPVTARELRACVQRIANDAASAESAELGGAAIGEPPAAPVAPPSFAG